MNGQAPQPFRRFSFVFAVMFLLVGAPLAAQTSTAGAGIDIELINPNDASNTICVNPDQAFTVRLWFHPGTGTAACTLACGSIPGGNSHVATAVIDIDFDEAAMAFTGASDNPDAGYAAVDGLIQDNSSSGRVGWALAGDWSPDASTAGTLADPCSTTLLDAAGWLAEFNFTAGNTPSSTILHLRRQTDTLPFALSCADFCDSTTAFTQENGGIDEVIDATVYVSATCPAGLFSDGFESGDTMHWSGGSR